LIRECTVSYLDEYPLSELATRIARSHPVATLLAKSVLSPRQFVTWFRMARYQLPSPVVERLEAYEALQLTAKELDDRSQKIAARADRAFWWLKTAGLWAAAALGAGLIVAQLLAVQSATPFLIAAVALEFLFTAGLTVYMIRTRRPASTATITAYIDSVLTSPPWAVHT